MHRPLVLGLLTTAALGLGVANASAATLPTVYTESAGQISETSATLSSCANPGGADTTLSFNYGTTLEYGNVVSPEDGDINGGVNTAECQNIALHDLVPDTVYYYEATALNENGSVVSAAGAFQTTPGELPVSSEVSATAASNLVFTSNALSYFLAPNGSSTGSLEEEDATTEEVTQTQTISDFTADLSGSFPEGASARLLVNGIASGQACSVHGSGSCSDTNDTITLHPGDKLTLLVQHQGLGFGVGEEISTADFSYATDVLNAPAVNEVETESVSENEATVGADVSTEGTSTLYAVKYGPAREPEEYTTPLSNLAPPRTHAVSPSTSRRSVSKTLSGLTNGVHYVYKIVARNAGGVTTSSSGAFTTGARVATKEGEQEATPESSQTPPSNESGAPNNPEAPKNPVAPCEATALTPLAVSTHVNGHVLTLSGHVNKRHPSFLVYHRVGCKIQRMKPTHVSTKHGKFVITLKMLARTQASAYLVTLG